MNQDKIQKWYGIQWNLVSDNRYILGCGSKKKFPYYY